MSGWLALGRCSVAGWELRSSSSLLEDLATLDKSPLRVLASIDEIRVVESELNSAVHNVVRSFNTKHEGMVLVANFVSPAAETSSRVDVLGLELGEELGEDALTLKGRGWVTMVETAVVCGDNFIGGLDHFGVDQTLDGVPENVRLVDRLHGRFRDLQHDGPVWTFLRLAGCRLAAIGQVFGWEFDGFVRLVVWGVVRKDRCSVEWAVVLWEVELHKCEQSRSRNFRIDLPSTCLQCSPGALLGFRHR